MKCRATRGLAAVFAGVLGLLAAACQDDEEPPPEVVDLSRVLESVDIVASYYEMSMGEGLQIEAYATYGDGSRRDMTRRVQWLTANATIAEFSRERLGFLQSVSVGRTTIRARLEDETSDESTVVVAEYLPSGVRIGTDLPDGLRMLRGASTRLSAELYWFHGESADVTDEVEWSLDDDASGVVVDGVLTALRTGPLRLNARVRNYTGELGIEVECPYPAGDRGFAPGLVAPRLRWSTAVDADGDAGGFAIEDVDCGRDHEDDAALVVVLGDEGCDACDRYLDRVLVPLARALDDAGAALVYVHARDMDGEPADALAAASYLDRFGDFGDFPMRRVGDGDVFEGEAPMPGWFQENVGLGRLPRVWVVRGRDMQVIADQGPGPELLPLPDIVADIEADWSDPPPYRAPFVAACEPADEEPSEPNDTAAEAAPLAPGVHPGGLCTDPAVDLYAIDLPGRWRLAADFEHAVGDIDLVLWDAAADAPLADPDGRPLGSFGVGDREIVVHDGPARVQVRGYANASGRYTLTLEAL